MLFIKLIHARNTQVHINQEFWVVFYVVPKRTDFYESMQISIIFKVESYIVYQGQFVVQSSDLFVWPCQEELSFK